MSHDMITIQLNGEQMEVGTPISLAALLANNELDKGRFVAVVNDEVIPKSTHDDTVLNTGDVVDVMTPITGG